ncbi:PREDICTED: B3 domain-containing protein REM20-like [Ipomoea nil]|uniref:B3 domain-containing protein REM20-like n=1 Tax=Ipomoea nil TaxID=35883 RepID=UPI000901F4FB|nr:PREDICTED: B3 domain-containing protein REM20-like [Ipomoea nil]
MEPRKRYQRKVVLRNRMKKVWNIEITYTGDCCFFKHGWAKFVKDNSFINGDTLVFIYDHPTVFDFFVLDSSGCEKIIIEGEEARVKGLKNNNGNDVNFQDNAFLVEFDVNIVTQVRKDEDEIDVEEENNDSFLNLGGSKRAAKEKKRDVSPKKGNVDLGKKDARAKKRDVSKKQGCKNPA